MKLAPFGVLKTDLVASGVGIFTPMSEWKSDDEDFRETMQLWLDDVQDSIWPSWNGTDWDGASAATKEARAFEELQIAVELYHGTNGNSDFLDTAPDTPMPSDNILRDHRWHFRVEDAVLFHSFYAEEKLPAAITDSFEYQSQKTGVANFLIYDPTFDHNRFIDLFFGALQAVNPQVFHIKAHFQRPRPSTAATALAVEGFRWITADRFVHTGVHPSLLSGHCIQGILCCCSVLDRLIDAGELTDQRKLAIQQYMVDWGDRRVFAGVHYMTDNIASWTLARRLIPHIFKNTAQIQDIAVQAITQHSQVFSDIVEKFSPSSPEKAMLLRDFPEVVPAV